MSRVYALLLCFLLAGCSGFGASAPRPGDGVLTLQNQRTGERSTVQYRLPGSGPDPAGLWQLSYLMRDSNQGEGVPIDVRLFDFIDDICGALGLSPHAVVIITSGFRSPQTNAALRRKSGQVAENSYHLRGMAADIKIPGVPSSRVAQVAKQLRRGGVAYYASSDHVHVDIGPVRSWAAH
jgi:uncharacterized protein YcbK (DUF882 family)